MELKPEIEKAVVRLLRWKYGQLPTDEKAAAVVTVDSSQNWNSLFVALIADWKRQMLKRYLFVLMM